MEYNGDRNRRNTRKPPIKDGFDNILENNGFYRKQVARDRNTLFRAIADGLFKTQYYRFIVAKRAELIMNREKTLVHDEDNITEIDGSFPLLRHLGQSLKFRYEFVSSMDDELAMKEFDPIPNEAGENRQVNPLPCIQLCNSSMNNFDPIYSFKKVEKMAICQSILYQVLYENIFEISDAMDAAAAMLYGPVDPVRGKPEELDPDFDGTAMETLENFLIPFPYKVAKCMDPYTYRNIEFDAWTQEMKETSPSRSRNASISSRYDATPQRNERKTIGNLPPNTPCLLNFPDYGRQYGYVLGSTLDRRKMEVYIPLHDQCVFVDRSSILPINQMPKLFLDLPKRPDDCARFFANYNRDYTANYNRDNTANYIRDYTATVDHQEARNLNRNGENFSGANSEDPGDDPRERANRFNFSVPPPTLPSAPNGQPFFQQQPPQNIARSVIPAPLDLSQIVPGYVPPYSPPICKDRGCPDFGTPLAPCCGDPMCSHPQCVAVRQNMIYLGTSGFHPMVQNHPEVTTPVMVNNTTPVPNFQGTSGFHPMVQNNPEVTTPVMVNNTTPVPNFQGTSGFHPMVQNNPEVTTPVIVNNTIPVPNFIIGPLPPPTPVLPVMTPLTPTVFIPTGAVTPGFRRMFPYPSPVVTPLTTSVNPEGSVFVFPTLPPTAEHPPNMMPPQGP